LLGACCLLPLLPPPPLLPLLPLLLLPPLPLLFELFCHVKETFWRATRTHEQAHEKTMLLLLLLVVVAAELLHHGHEITAWQFPCSMLSVWKFCFYPWKCRLLLLLLLPPPPPLLLLLPPPHLGSYRLQNPQQYYQMRQLPALPYLP
jgi:hypothetical protein